jgi:two-component system, NtrC family, nitrogen regulation response regulator GlnG
MTGKTKDAGTPPVTKDKAVREPSLEEILTPRFRDLLEKIQGGKPNGLYDRVIASVERPLIRQALAVTEGNQIQAARLLGINRNTLKRKMDRLGVRG